MEVADRQTDRCGHTHTAVTSPFKSFKCNALSLWGEEGICDQQEIYNLNKSSELVYLFLSSAFPSKSKQSPENLSIARGELACLGPL
jgi:hypothetical protein